MDSFAYDQTVRLVQRFSVDDQRSIEILITITGGKVEREFDQQVCGGEQQEQMENIIAENNLPIDSGYFEEISRQYVKYLLISKILFIKSANIYYYSYYYYRKHLILQIGLIMITFLTLVI